MSILGGGAAEGVYIGGGGAASKNMIIFIHIHVHTMQDTLIFGGGGGGGGGQLPPLPPWSVRGTRKLPLSGYVPRYKDYQVMCHIIKIIRLCATL